jgi:predicted enzyme related to lactoylglutathione lyase
MITGIHAILYAKDADRVRAFFRDVLDFPSVDAGHGWLIFGLPPAEAAAHPTEGREFAELYLMTDDLQATMEKMKAKGVKFTQAVKNQGWGMVAHFELPGFGEMGIYQPRHPTAIALSPPPR